MYCLLLSRIYICKFVWLQGLNLKLALSMMGQNPTYFADMKNAMGSPFIRNPRTA